jgi:hypothetical protein
VLTLAALFSLDAFAGGLVVQSLQAELVFDQGPTISIGMRVLPAQVGFIV